MQKRIFYVGSLVARPRIIVAADKDEAMDIAGIQKGVNMGNAIDLTPDLMDNLKDVVDVLMEGVVALSKKPDDGDKIIPFPTPRVPSKTVIPDLPFKLPPNAKLISGGAIDATGKSAEEITKMIEQAIKNAFGDDAEVEISHYDLDGNEIFPESVVSTTNDFVPEVKKVTPSVEKTVETTSTETGAKYTDKIEVNAVTKLCPPEWRGKTLRIFFTDRLGTAGNIVTSEPSLVWESLTKYDFYTITHVQVRIA